MTKIRNLCVFVFVAGAAFAQRPATGLQSLIAEARQNNAAIKAAESAIQTSRYMPKQASALPDTEVMVQHFTVGSPRPFAGYSNSDFAYSAEGTRFHGRRRRIAVEEGFRCPEGRGLRRNPAL
jgi:hypothetical protein